MSVDLDRQLREYCRYIDETQGVLAVEDVLERSGELQVIPGRTNRQLSSRRKWIPAVIVAASILVVVIGIRLLPSGDPAPADQPPTTTITDPTTDVSNGWIAYSTQPGGTQISETDWNSGGDIYLVRPDMEPMLIVGRGEAKISNVCPSFSPDGSKLAYGAKTDMDTSLVVLNVSADGSVSDLTRIGLGAGESAPCPRWSHDGTRVAFLSEAGTAVVHGLDGSTPEEGDEDITVTELRATMPPIDGQSSIRSPDGSSLASLEDDLIIVVDTDDDGSERREVPAGCGDPPCYGLASWSPDGRYILVMKDTGATAQILAVSVEQPFETKVMVDSLPVNGARSWPGFGDISWQPVFSGS